jgi:hypothetical protein
VLKPSTTNSGCGFIVRAVYLDELDSLCTRSAPPFHAAEPSCSHRDGVATPVTFAG